VNLGLIRAVTQSLRDADRLPGGYYIEEGWLHCKLCHVGAMWPGEIPGHATGCRLAAAEAHQPTKVPGDKP
jgi:hypothetical protein